MPVPNEDEINDFLHRQLELWNEGKREEQTALYKRYAPKLLTVEYVGSPIGDGWATFEHMWDTYGGKIRVEADLLLVKGCEGACYHRNIRVATGLANPTIELYRFGDGELHVRYFANAAE
jgi:hypothetical protein